MKRFIYNFLSFFCRKQRYKGQVLDFGLKESTGEFVVMIKLTDGNPYHLKQFLETPDKQIAFTATVKEYSNGQ